MAIFEVGIVGIFSLLIARSLGAPFSPLAETVDKSDIEKNVGKIGHILGEMVRFGDSGNIVQVLSDGYEVTLDLKEKLALIQDAVSTECFLTGIGDNQFRPPVIYDEQPKTRTPTELSPFEILGRIPDELVEKIPGRIMDRCINRPSYWVEETSEDENSRGKTKRQTYDFGTSFRRFEESNRSRQYDFNRSRQYEVNQTRQSLEREAQRLREKITREQNQRNLEQQRQRDAQRRKEYIIREQNQNTLRKEANKMFG